MRIEISHNGKVGKHRIYYATSYSSGRPRRSDAIERSKKLFVTGNSRREVIEKYKEAVGFTPFDN